MKIFDLHCHPVVKTLLKEPSVAHSAWEPIPLKAKIISALESQSTLGQIMDSGTNLVCFTRHPIERGMLDQWKLRMAARFLEALDLRRLNELAAGVVSYSQQLEDEWTNLHKPAPGTYKGNTVKELRSLRGYKFATSNVLYLVFNIEGGHLFNEVGKRCDDVLKDEIRLKIEQLQQECPIIFYITPTHLTPNNLINHAYGNKMLSKKPFKPNAFGICDSGEMLIRAIYDHDILVDVKHMSLISRLQFFKLHEKFYSNKPIIASHFGFTGYSIKELLDVTQPTIRGRDFVKIKKPCSNGGVAGTRFYPNSINLCDDEIDYILNSGGLIGLIFDTRILGAESSDSETEFLSWPEYKVWINEFADPSLYVKLLDIKDFYTENEDEIFYTAEDLDEFENELELYFPLKTEPLSKERFDALVLMHLMHFINHLLYLLKLYKDKLPGQNPWKQVCIGSDFDGMISAMYCCRNASELPAFAELLRQHLPIEAKKAGLTIPGTVDEFIEDLFFENAFRVLKEQFP